jgi:hypothetical protein
VQQSLSRIEKLERATNIQVNRVVVPPYEALIEPAIAAMLSLGVEGASLAPWSLRDWNQNKVWPSTFGLEMTDLMTGGFPTLGRYKLSKDCQGPAVISAFLGRPIVLAEHHGALSTGYCLLSSVAAFINSLGDIAWCSTQAMLRSSFLRRREGTTMWLKPYSCRIEYQVPEGIDSVGLSLFDGTYFTGASSFRLVRRSKGILEPSENIQADVPFAVVPGEAIELVSPRLGDAIPDKLASQRLSLTALSRRVACEARDRLVGLKPRYTTKGGAL